MTEGGRKGTGLLSAGLRGASAAAGKQSGARLFVRTGYFRQVKLFSIVPEILMSGLPPSSCAAQP